MRRLFWVALGATAGILIARQVSRVIEAWTPEGVAGGVAGLGDRMTMVWSEMREAMAEREAELRAALELPDSSEVDA